MNLQTTKVIFLNTIQKEFRNKVFLFLFFMTLLGILLATLISYYVFKEVVPAQATAFFGDKTLDVLFGIIHFWTLIVSMILGVNCISSDFENNNIISQLISLPIKRVEYISARVLGTWAITAFYYLFSYLVALISFSLVAGSFVGSFSIIPAFFVTGLSSLGIICIAALLSFSAPKLFSFILSFISYLFISYCNGAFSEVKITEVVSQLGVGKLIALAGHLLLPPLGSLNSISHSLLMGGGLSGGPSILLTLIHFALTFALLFFVLSWVFKRRDI